MLAILISTENDSGKLVIWKHLAFIRFVVFLTSAIWYNQKVHEILYHTLEFYY